jgi:hypothetical protein
MSSDCELTELSKAVVVAVESAADGAIGDRRAAVSVVEDPDGDLVVQLEPNALGAAPLDVRVDTEHQVSCFPGRSGMIVELFSNDLEELVRGVSDLASAVVAGTYCEWVNESRAKTRIAASWVGGGRTVKARLNVLFPPRRSARRGGNWRSVRYEAY